MVTTIRCPTVTELAELTDLSLRSKAVWGYDAAFMTACSAELTLKLEDLHETSIVVAIQDDRIVAVAQVAATGETGELVRIFVDPARLGLGVGRALFVWAVSEGRRLGAKRMTIDADPNAVPFYAHMGAKRIGTVPSGSIPGRTLPLLEVDLRSTA